MCHILCYILAFSNISHKKTALWLHKTAPDSQAWRTADKTRKVGLISSCPDIWKRSPFSCGKQIEAVLMFWGFFSLCGLSASVNQSCLSLPASHAPWLSFYFCQFYHFTLFSLFPACSSPTPCLYPWSFRTLKYCASVGCGYLCTALLSVNEWSRISKDSPPHCQRVIRVKPGESPTEQEAQIFPPLAFIFTSTLLIHQKHKAIYLSYLFLTPLSYSRTLLTTRCPKCCTHVQCWWMFILIFFSVTVICIDWSVVCSQPWNGEINKIKSVHLTPSTCRAEFLHWLHLTNMFSMHSMGNSWSPLALCQFVAHSCATCKCHTVCIQHVRRESRWSGKSKQIHVDRPIDR